MMRLNEIDLAKLSDQLYAVDPLLWVRERARLICGCGDPGCIGDLYPAIDIARRLLIKKGVAPCA